ncbi:MAG: DUF4097 family beta strand repeat-containing protein [bacterium]
MKKILIASGIFFAISLVFITSAFAVSGFDMFELTNFNNYTKNEEYYENINSLEINESIITKIDKHSEDKILVVYYTNDNSKYTITNEENNLNILADISSNKSFGFSFGFNINKGIEIYLPQNSNIDINITSKDCVLDIEDITVNNILINSEDGVINIEDVTCNSLNLTLENGVTNLEDVKSPNIEITIENGVLNVELPYTKNQYTLEIDVKTFCNVSSGGTGANLLKIKADNGIVSIKFD